MVAGDGRCRGRAGDIAYVNAHGSGTFLNDTVEAGVADALFPATTKLYSTKMLTGHGLGAGGALEARSRR